MSIDRLEAIPAAVRLFLEERVNGLEHLEVLMLVCRDPERSWTVIDAAAKTAMPADSAMTALAELHAAQLVMPTDDSRTAYRFHPASPALRQTCLELAARYDDDRFAIVLAMSQLAMDRVRRSAARAFADAFRIRKPPTGGS